MNRSELLKLKNIGPKTAQWLMAVGIDTPELLRTSGPEQAWRDLRAAGYPIKKIGLYALYAALLDIDWRCLSPQQKQSLDLIVLHDKENTCQKLKK